MPLFPRFWEFFEWKESKLQMDGYQHSSICIRHTFKIFKKTEKEKMKKTQ